MCGFAGILNSKENISSGYLKSVAKVVSFRGPDSTDIRVFNNDLQIAEDGSCGFFFNRLSIIDLHTRSNQPFERDNCMLLFNGEIYNYKTIKKELEKAGVEFETTSDTEVLFY